MQLIALPQYPAHPPPDCMCALVHELILTLPDGKPCPACIFYPATSHHRMQRSYMTTAVEVDPERPVLVDKYLDRATELDVDALADKDGNVVICGIMEHIEQVSLTAVLLFVFL
jgi:Carbamoyl-phosphate synthase L chain, ATP binding domain